jgi:epsin
MDTFGNTGNLRKLPCRLCSLPCSHAPGIPVGSGFHSSNRMAFEQTGQGPHQTGFGANNPFGQVGQQQKPTDQPFFSV